MSSAIMQVDSEVEVVNIDDIDVDESYQVNVRHPDEGTIKEYADVLREDMSLEMPDIVIFEVAVGDEWLWVVPDGLQRLLAYQRCGRKTISARRVTGDMEAARLYSAGCNISHGRRRTNAEKRAAISAVLEIAADWSSRRIAKHCGVSDKTVEDVREELAKLQRNVDDTDPEGVLGDDADSTAEIRSCAEPPENKGETNGEPQVSVVAPPEEVRVGADGKKRSAKKAGAEQNPVQDLKEAKTHFGKFLRIIKRADLYKDVRPHLNAFCDAMKGKW